MLKIVVACPTKVSFNLGSLETSHLGGLETASIELARGLAARGHQVVLAGKADTRVQHDGVTTIPLTSLPEIDCDVLISSNDARVFDQGPAKARKILWLHNPMAIEKAIRRSQLVPLLKHRPDAVYVGRVAEEEMSRLYPFGSRSVIPHGVSRMFLQSLPQGPRQSHFVWASQRQRGLARTLDAWRAHIAPYLPNASFHIFGTRAEEMSLTPEQANKDRVVFHGPALKSEMAAFYSSAKAMLYPGAPDETFCMAAAEAQAMGLPVITLGIGSLSERVAHGVNGAICRDFADMGYWARRISEDEELWRILSAGAVQTAHLLTWERATKLWETLILGRGPSQM